MHYIILPARYHSSRFPGKLLEHVEENETVLYKSYVNAESVARLLNNVAETKTEVWIATEDKEIEDHAKKFTDKIIFTHKWDNGTSRVFDAASKLINPQVVVNWQAEWFGINPRRMAQSMVDWSNCSCVAASFYYRQQSIADSLKPNKVRVVLDNRDHSMYFSRQPIPHNAVEYKIHIGIYAYVYPIIIESIRYCQIKHKNLGWEKLEQLYFQAMGITYHMYELNECFSIDTKEDLDIARQKLS